MEAAIRVKGERHQRSAGQTFSGYPLEEGTAFFLFDGEWLAKSSPYQFQLSGESIWLC